MAASRQRNALPLPLLPREVPPDAGGRGGALAWIDWADDGVEAINWLVGGGAPPTRKRPSVLPQRSLDYTAAQRAKIGGPPADISRSNSLSDLRSSCPLYSAGRGNMVSYSKDLVPWPSGGSAPVALRDALLEADRLWLQDGRPACFAHLMKQRPFDETSDSLNSVSIPSSVTLPPTASSSVSSWAGACCACLQLAAVGGPWGSSWSP
eukprot:1738678-Pyramimonas_sp.AAC.1